MDLFTVFDAALSRRMSRCRLTLTGCRPDADCRFSVDPLPRCVALPVAPPPPPDLQGFETLTAVAACLLSLALCWWLTPPGLLRPLLRMAFCSHRRRPGEISGWAFPTSVADLSAEDLNHMLSSHLEPGVRVLAVERKPIDVTDGVKGDKAILGLRYSGPTTLPTTLFIKFQLGRQPG